MSSLQLLPPLGGEEYERLKISIEEHGVIYPALIDAADGVVVDGHHRMQICSEIGITCPTIEREFADEAEREIVAIETNLARRQMGPVTWGEWFNKLLERKGIRRGQGSRNDMTSENASEVAQQAASQQGVTERTARNRMALADTLQDFPTLRSWVDGQTKFPQKGALEIAREMPDLANAIEGGEYTQNAAKEEYQRRTPERPRASKKAKAELARGREANKDKPKRGLSNTIATQYYEADLSKATKIIKAVLDDAMQRDLSDQEIADLDLAISRHDDAFAILKAHVCGSSGVDWSAELEELEARWRYEDENIDESTGEQIG